MGTDLQVVVNGRLVKVQQGATVGDVKQALDLPGGEQLVELSGKTSEAKSDRSSVKGKSRYRSIPPITQG